MKMSRLRVLYIHGLEGGPFSRKVRSLRDDPELIVHCEKMDIWDLPGNVYPQAAVIPQFEPNVVVASSYGTIILAILQNIGEWHGPSVYLSQVVTLVGLTLPIGSTKYFIHGDRDAWCDSASTLELALRCRGYSAVVEDDHALRKTTELGLLSVLIKHIYRRHLRLDVVSTRPLYRVYLLAIQWSLYLLMMLFYSVFKKYIRWR